MSSTERCNHDLDSGLVPDAAIYEQNFRMVKIDAT